MKKIIKIRHSDMEFYYGSCVTIAICSCFGINKRILYLIGELMGIKDLYDGATFFDCKKLINRIAAYLRYNVRYVPNHAGLTFLQMAAVLDKHKYIVMFDNHLSYMEEGVIIDNYMDEQQIKKAEPTGWWEII